MVYGPHTEFCLSKVGRATKWSLGFRVRSLGFWVLGCSCASSCHCTRTDEAFEACNDKSFCGDVLGLCADVLLLVPFLGDMLDNLKSTACDIKVECAEPA